MDQKISDNMKSDFQSVARFIGDRITAFSPRVVALAAKWQRDDLIPGLSDLDFRLICTDEIMVEEWIYIDREIGRIHLEMVSEHPEWNRINEHTIGAAMTLGEIVDRRFHNPEYAVWTCWIGDDRWLKNLHTHMHDRPFGEADEHFHLSKFLSYYSPYQHGIDPGINLGVHALKYPLHSRCWHYFAPPMLSAACLLSGRNLHGKLEGLGWLHDHNYISGSVHAVLTQIGKHYETPELVDDNQLRIFEELLFTGFRQLLPALLDAVHLLKLPESTDVVAIKQFLSRNPANPYGILMENLRFARTRLGRYYFYLNAPAHFDANRQIVGELIWARKLTREVFDAMRAIAGQRNLQELDCLQALNITMSSTESHAVQYMLNSANITSDVVNARRFFETAIELFPHYFRVINKAFEKARRI